MLIDHNSIVQKTDLRQNFAQILSRVYKGETLFISDRGNVRAKITVINSKTDKKESVEKMMRDLQKIRSQLAKAGWGKENSTTMVRSMRKERSQYLFDRDK